MFSFAPVVEGIWGECSGRKDAEWGYLGGVRVGPWFKDTLGRPELGTQPGNGGPQGSGCQPGGEGTSLPDEKSWLAGGLSGAPQELLRAAKAKVIVQSTLLASFQASLESTRVPRTPATALLVQTRRIAALTGRPWQARGGD